MLGMKLSEVLASGFYLFGAVSVVLVATGSIGAALAARDSAGVRTDAAKKGVSA
jgi:hypothetical protein